MDPRHSTDTEETLTARTLRGVLDGPIDTKLHLIQHHAKRGGNTITELNPGTGHH